MDPLERKALVVRYPHIPAALAELANRAWWAQVGRTSWAPKAAWICAWWGRASPGASTPAAAIWWVELARCGAALHARHDAAL